MATLADQAVLNAIFNPLSPNDNYQPIPLGHTSLKSESNEKADELTERVKQIEKNAIKLAEEGKYDESIASFSSIISMKPDWASGYNNRAQAYRLAGQVSEAKVDLDKAIHLTQGRGNVGANALCQRALINHLNGSSEGALNDLKAAAEQGHPLASQFLVQLNPYAALCNQMLSQMIAQLSQSKC